MATMKIMKKMNNKDILSDPDTYITDPGTLTVNLQTFEVSVHDGVTPGGLPVGGGGPLPPGVATETYVNNAIADLVDSAPAALDTLNELANALADDPNFAGTMTTALAGKANTVDLATVATSGSYVDLVDIPVPVGSHLFYIDRRRTDTYTADGSAAHPFKTIAAAISQATTNGDGGSTPYTFLVNEGTYPEEINLNNTGLSNVSIIGLGRVAIDPAAGNSLTCTTDNNNLLQLVIRNMEFTDPVVITGNSTANQFNNVVFYNISMGVLTATCMNTLSIRGGYISGNITLSNVAWFYWDGVQHDAQTATIVSDTTATMPSFGMANAGGYFVGGKFQDFALTRTGTGNFNLNINNCYTGLVASSYTLPTGFTLNARNSTMRGSWTNNGTVNLYATSMLLPVLGTAPNYPGVRAPSAASGTPDITGAPGDVAGQVRYDAGFVYVCVADYDGVSNIWMKAALVPV